MPFKCHCPAPRTELLTHSSSAVAPFFSRTMRGYQESVAYTLPSASTVRSLQKPFTVVPGSIVPVGAGQAKLAVGAPVVRLKALRATGAVPVREPLPASDEQTHNVFEGSSAYRPSTETSPLEPAAMNGAAVGLSAVPL